MRLKFAAILLASGALALPASAQGFHNACTSVQQKNSTTGMIAGALIGGVLGSNLAGKGVRDEGTALGAVIGGMAGSAAGKGSVNCGPSNYGNPGAYGGYDAYGSSAYADPYGSGSYYSAQPTLTTMQPTYRPEPAYAPPPSPYGGYPAYSDDYSTRHPQHYAPGYDDRYAPARDTLPPRFRPDDLVTPDRGAYNSGSDFAGRECSRADQITLLPDGSELRKPVDVCRDAYYGGWTIRD